MEAAAEKKVKIVSIAILHWGMREIIENQYLSYDPLMPVRCALPFDFFRFCLSSSLIQYLAAALMYIFETSKFHKSFIYFLLNAS